MRVIIMPYRVYEVWRGALFLGRRHLHDALPPRYIQLLCLRNMQKLRRGYQQRLRRYVVLSVRGGHLLNGRNPLFPVPLGHIQRHG